MSDSKLRSVTIWATLVLATATPLGLAAFSPYLQWRDGYYIAAGFAGIAGLALLLVQPLLTLGWLPGLSPRRERAIHRLAGGLIVLAMAVHVVGLYITSAPDVIDALLLRSPTPFSIWGVAALWAVMATACLATLRRRLRPVLWRVVHMVLAVIIISGTIVHALLIEGTMEFWSKIVLCALVGAASLAVLIHRRKDVATFLRPRR